MSNPAQERFDEVYQRLSEVGRTDCPGSYEYRRVLDEWKQAGSPIAGIEHFIAARANAVPDSMGRRLVGREQLN